MYVVAVAAVRHCQSREYYVAPAYPMLYAAGSVAAEAWLARCGHHGRRFCDAWCGLFWSWILQLQRHSRCPSRPVNSAWFKMAREVNGDFQCEEIGWPELVETVAHIRDSLPTQDRVHLGILATKKLWRSRSGESLRNTIWIATRYQWRELLLGAGLWESTAPSVVIVLGLPREFVDKKFCRLPTGCSLMEPLQGTKRGNASTSGHLRLPWAAPRVGPSSGKTFGISVSER
jgi:hypothetical protein